jgi:hypothetical protein
VDDRGSNSQNGAFGGMQEGFSPCVHTPVVVESRRPNGTQGARSKVTPAVSPSNRENPIVLWSIPVP